MQEQSTTYLKFNASQIMQNFALISKYPAIQGQEFPILTLQSADWQVSQFVAVEIHDKHVVSQIEQAAAVSSKKPTVQAQEFPFLTLKSADWQVTH